jgi:hypothetical protein
MQEKKLRVNSLIREGMSSRELVDLLSKIIKALNGGIEFGTFNTGAVNINGAWVTGITPGVINTDFSLTHNLGRIPTGWLLVWKDGYVDFKIGGGAWTSKQIFLQASVAAVNYRVFVF